MIFEGVPDTGYKQNNLCDSLTFPHLPKFLFRNLMHRKVFFFFCE